MTDKFLNLLGMARRCGRLAPGHDAAISSIVKNQAKLCLLSFESSERLKKEMSHACSYGGKNIELIITEYTIADLSKAIGTKAAVICITDEGFAKTLKEKYSSFKAEN